MTLKEELENRRGCRFGLSGVRLLVEGDPVTAIDTSYTADGLVARVRAADGSVRTHFPEYCELASLWPVVCCSPETPNRFNTASPAAAISRFALPEDKGCAGDNWREKYERLESLESDREQALQAAEGWPPALLKACQDQFDYTAGVKGLGTVSFTHAKRVAAGWVSLEEAKLFDGDIGAPDGDSHPLSQHWLRGLEVRLSEITWVADGGH